jgi:PKD repeat protein
MHVVAPRRGFPLRALASLLLVVALCSPTAEAADPVQITTPSVPAATVGVSYSVTSEASGGVPPYEWQVSGGALPRGLTLRDGGVLAGTPTVAGSYSFEMRTRDSIGTYGEHRARKRFTLEVNTTPPPPPPPDDPPPPPPPDDPPPPPPPDDPPPPPPPDDPPPPPPPAEGDMTTANRTSGVAPLGVFFDAVDTTTPMWVSGVVQPSGTNYAVLRYEWDFGDPNSGNWTTTGKNRNVATGYTAAHVYETPGTYVATLTVTNPATNATFTYGQTITVNAFTGTTYYVDATSGNDANDGLAPTSAWRTVAKAFSSGVKTNSQVLFRRGQTHTSTGTTRIGVAGPGILGAYGTGSKPVLRITSTTGGIQLFQSNWRLMDLEIRGDASSGTVAVTGIGGSGTHNDNLYLRLTARLVRTSFQSYYSSDWWDNPHSGNVIADCEVGDTNQTAVYMGGQRLAVLGTTIEDDSTTHCLRVWQMHKGVISNCVIRRPSATRHAIKLHCSPDWQDGALETKFVTINDNIIRGRSWAVSIGPQDSQNDEHISQIVFERNVTEGDPAKSVDVMINARNVTIRNNLFIGTGASGTYRAVTIARRGIEPTPRYVDVYNNTMYRADAGNFWMVSVNSTCADVNVKNNLGFAPATDSSHKAVMEGTCTGLVVSNNLLTDTPGFVNASGGDFHLTSTSPALNAGALLPDVWEDLERKLRGTAPDIGAFER